MFFITTTWADLWHGHGKAAWTELALLLPDFGKHATSLSPSKISTQFPCVCPESHSTQEGKDIHSTALTFHLRTAAVVLKTDLWSAWTKKAGLAECRWCYSRQLTDLITSVPVGQVITRTKKQLHTAYYQTKSVQRQILLTWDSQACPMVASITKMTLSGLYTNKRTSGCCSLAQQHFLVSAAKNHFKQGLSEQSEYSNHCDNNNWIRNNSAAIFCQFFGAVLPVMSNKPPAA